MADPRVILHLLPEDDHRAAELLRAHAPGGTLAFVPESWDREALYHLTGYHGFTVKDHFGDAPTTGYMVSIDKTSEEVFPLHSVTPEIIGAYRQRHAAALRAPNAFLGAWVEGGRAFLDVSTHTNSLDEALALAREHGQLAVFDLASGETIYTDQAKAAARRTAARVHTVWGTNNLDALFPDDAPITTQPFERASRTRDRPTFWDQEAVLEALRDPNKASRMQAFDPRTLEGTQPNVTRQGVAYYMGEDYRRTGRTFADHADPGNRVPVVYVRSDGRQVIVSGHHRAVAAALKGEPLMALRVDERTASGHHALRHAVPVHWGAAVPAQDRSGGLGAGGSERDRVGTHRRAALGTLGHGGAGDGSPRGGREDAGGPDALRQDWLGAVGGLTASHEGWRPTRGMFEPGKATLDPRVFDPAERMWPQVRSAVLGPLTAFWAARYPGWQSWARVYLAGSGASHWWDSDHDFDTLIGVDIEALRRARPANIEVSEADIVAHLNRELKTELDPATKAVIFDAGQAPFDVTYFVNPGSYDIRAIKPYAAYSITDDTWVIRPPDLPADWGPSYFPESVWRQAEEIARQAEAVLAIVDPVARHQACMSLFDSLHAWRHLAYTEHGRGWLDFGNLVWQYLSQRPDRLLPRLYVEKHTMDAMPVTAVLDTRDYEGEVGRSDHITRTQRGTIDTHLIAHLLGVAGEQPGQHRNKQGEKWAEFVADIRANGVREPIFITVDYGEAPKISEGNHRRDAAVEAGLPEVPVEIRYFGHAEQLTSLGASEQVFKCTMCPDSRKPFKTRERAEQHVMEKHLHGVGGLIEKKRVRRTGTEVGIYDGEAAGMDTDAGRWQTVCEEHGGIISHRTLELARKFAPVPDEWCEECMEQAENKHESALNVLAGPGSNRIPDAMRAMTAPFGRMLRQPRPVVLDDPAEEDIEEAPHDIKMAVVKALHDLQQGKANLEAKVRDLVGAFTVRITQSWRAAVYLGAEGFWHCFWVGDHNYGEAERRFAKVAALPKTQTCKFCKEQATKRLLWAEGMAYIPVCDTHEDKARHVIEVDNHDEVIKVMPIEKTALTDADVVSVAEHVMDQQGHVGKRWHVPSLHYDDPNRIAAQKPVNDWVNGVLREHGHEGGISVKPKHWDLRNGGQAVTDGLNYIGIAGEDTDELTLLHEVAHILARTPEGPAGHNAEFQRIAGDLYEQHLGAEAASIFRDITGVAREHRITSTEQYENRFYPAKGGGKYHRINRVTDTARCRGIELDTSAMPITVDKNQERVHPIVCRRCLNWKTSAVTGGLDAAVAEFLSRYGDRLEDPNFAYDQCVQVSEEFLRTVQRHGGQGEVISGGRMGEFLGQPVLEQGHFAVRVGDEVYDWTARQFHPDADVPEVMSYDEWRGHWPRIGSVVAYGTDLIARGLTLELQDADEWAVPKMQAKTLTAQDMLRLLDPHLGVWWGVMGDYGDLVDFEDHATRGQGSLDDDVTVRAMIEEGRTGEDFIGGECAVVLVAKRPKRGNDPWDPQVHNPLNALMGNSYLESGEPLELVEIRYDAGWGWVSLPCHGIRAQADYKGPRREDPTDIAHDNATIYLTANPPQGSDLVRQFAVTPAASDFFAGEADDLSRAYRDMPVLDPSVVPLWQEMAVLNAAQAAALRSVFTIVVHDDIDPYMTAEEMHADIDKGVYQVTSLHSHHPVWTPQQNVDFRIVHDLMGHGVANSDFSLKGEVQAYQAQCRIVPPRLWPVLFTEIIAQASYANTHHLFGEQKVGLVPLTQAEIDAHVGKIMDAPDPEYDRLHYSASAIPWVSPFSGRMELPSESGPEDARFLRPVGAHLAGARVRGQEVHSGVVLDDLPNEVRSDVRMQQHGSTGRYLDRTAGRVGAPVPVVGVGDRQGVEDVHGFREDGRVVRVDRDAQQRAVAVMHTEVDRPFAVNQSGQPRFVHASEVTARELNLSGPWWHGATMRRAEEVKAHGFPSDYMPRGTNYGPGLYLTNSRERAHSFGMMAEKEKGRPGAVLELDHGMTNPFVAKRGVIEDDLAEAYPDTWAKYKGTPDAIQRTVTEHGHDGVLIPFSRETWAIVYQPGKVKYVSHEPSRPANFRAATLQASLTTAGV